MDQETKFTEIPVGTPIIYYNLWTRFETDAFREQFKRLTEDDIKKLSKGDIIYVDIDPLHPRGKVYGYIKAAVTDIELTAGAEVRIHYRGGCWVGYKTTLRGVCHSILKAVDEEALARITAELAMSSVIDPKDL